MNKIIATTLLTATLIAGPASAFDGGRSDHGLIASHLEIIPNGYDFVEVTETGKRVRGKARYNHTHDGRIYIFANRTNRDLFAFDPDRYLGAPRG